jgi:hypothetical protein
LRTGIHTMTLIRSTLTTILLLTLLSTTQTVFAFQPKAVTAGVDKGFMPVAEVKPGMKGRSLTVFEGTEPEEFDVEIIGVVPGSIGPRQDMIVGRISGGKTDRTSVFAGMSGSPVYVDGRLVGAISFAFPFAKEALCGITPIEQMVEIFEKESPITSRKQVAITWENLSAVANAEMRKTFQGRSGRIDVESPLGVVAGQLFVPIAVPLSFNGISKNTLDLFAPQLNALGLVPVAGISGSAGTGALARSTKETLTGGRSISVQLARGDYSLVASGTATLRDGDRVYAFGHPFLSLGSVEMPMSESSVVVVVPNINNSFKLAVPGPMVGTMLQDRATGILGEIGKAPRMIPVRLDLTTSRGKKETVSFEMVSDEFLTPLVLNIGLVNSVLANERHIGDTTVTTNAKIRIKGHDPVIIERDFTGSAATTLSSLSVTLPVSNLLRGRFDDLDIESIEVEVTVAEGARTAVIESLRSDRLQFRAGETGQVTVFTRMDSGHLMARNVQFKIPNDTQPGSLTLTVSDAVTAQQNSVANSFTATSLKEAIALLNRVRKDDRLYLQLHRPGNSIVMGSNEMPNLPPSVTASMNSGNSSGGSKSVAQNVILDVELGRSDVVATGSQSIKINIVR